MSYGIGVHDIAAEIYHADPCETPSLSRSGIARLLSGTPEKFMAWHPRLTRWPKEETEERETTAQRLGNAIHALLLDQEHRVFCVPGFDNWMKAKAREKRDEICAMGGIALLEKEQARVLQVCAEATHDLREQFGAWPIGESEQTLIWHRDTRYGRIECRALVDHLVVGHPNFTGIIDIKSTALDLEDAIFSRKLEKEHGDLQAAWNLEGFRVLFPDMADLAEFTDFAINIDPPYESRFFDPDAEWLTHARARIDRACELFAKCLHSGEWPSFSQKRVKLSAPAYRLSQWEEEELAELGESLEVE